MVKVNKGKDRVGGKTKEPTEEDKKKIELEGKIEAIKEGRAKKLTSGQGELSKDVMLVYREKDATWYLGEGRILDNDRHLMNGQKVYEVTDFDRLLENLRNRQKFSLGIPNMIIWKDYDTQDELVGWASPYDE